MNAKELRKQTTRYKEHQPCEVCGKHKEITHLHHVVNLKDCTILFNVVDYVNTPVVFLCPNCHAMTENYMALNKGKSSRKKRYII